jgi:ATP adenylyltransferase
MASQRLWAPWRIEYIKGDKTDECIFCARPAAGDDDANLIPYRGERCFVMLNAFPYNNGHLMVAPYEHVPELQKLDERTSGELTTLTQRSLRALDRAYAPDGYNIGLNQGRVAGAGFEEHVHVHVVPRWAGDSNFMPVVGDTRVLPESLRDTYSAVRGAFDVMDEVDR